MIARRRKALGLAIILLVVPFAAEGTYRSILFLSTRNAASGAAFEIFAVGESTMMGAHTRPKISIPALVAAMFGGRIGDRPIVVHMLARAGQPLYAQSVALSEATAFRDRRNPGVMLLYSGHNEGRLSGTVDTAAVWRPGWYERLERWSMLARSVRLALIPSVPSLRGGPELGRYEYELRTTIETASASGLVPILSTAAGNVSGVEPTFGGRDPDGAHASIEAALSDEQHTGCGSVETRCGARAPADADVVALLCYEAAKCVHGAGDVERARELYWEAVDLDVRNHWGRATRAQNDLIRRLTTEYGIPLVDSVALLERESPSGILGNDLFVDGQHPGLMGEIIIAKGYAIALSRAFDVPIAREFTTAADAMSSFDFTPADQSASHVLSASWLMGMAAEHPWPYDALSLAEAHTRSAIALAPDDFTAWFDLAIIQAARRSALLRDPAALKVIGNWDVFFSAAACVHEAELDDALHRLRVGGADPEALEAIRRLRSASCRPQGAVARY